MTESGRRRLSDQLSDDRGVTTLTTRTPGDAPRALPLRSSRSACFGTKEVAGSNPVTPTTLSFNGPNGSCLNPQNLPLKLPSASPRAHQGMSPLVRDLLLTEPEE